MFNLSRGYRPFKKHVINTVFISSITLVVFLILFDYISREYIAHSEKQRIIQLKQLVQVAINSIEPVLLEYRSGYKTREKTIVDIRNLVRRMTFQEEHGTNYIFMSSYTGLMLVQPFEPKKEMTSQWELQDAEGIYIIQKLVAMARKEKDGGYVKYHYTLPGRNSPEEKISYVIGIPELECYIGAGRYMGDIRREQASFRLKIFGLELILLFLLLIMILNFIVNISERKQAEEALSESEAHLRALIEKIPDLVWLKDPDGFFLYCNQKFERFFGAKQSEIVGKTDYDFVDRQLADFFREKDKAVMDADQSCVNEEEVVYSDDGHKEMLETIKTPMYDSQNRLIGVLGIARDITKRKQAEEKLKNAQNYISNIIDSMPSILMGVDADCKVTQWNKTSEQKTGLSYSDVKGKKISDVFPQMVWEIEKITESIRTRKTKYEQKKPRQSEAGVYYEDVTIYPLIANGVDGAVIRIDNVTDKVRMEEMIVQNEKMLSVGGLAAGMAHEINNPIAGMIQTASVMGNRLTDITMPANRRVAAELGVNMDVIKSFVEKRDIPRMIKAINESGKRVADIVGNMLSFARKSDFALSSNDLADLLDKALELAASDYDLKKQYDFRSIEIKKEYEHGLPLVLCEQARIQQVILNILRNGAQSMHEAGIKKPLFIIRTRFEKDRGMACIDIEDNGPGMKEAIRKRVFEPFFTTKPVGLGTGLGLSVSYFIITENHGGEMIVESEIGKGSKFIIRLPLKGKNNDI